MAVNIEGKVVVITGASSGLGESNEEVSALIQETAGRPGNHFRGGATALHKRVEVPRYGDVFILMKVVTKNHSIS